MIFTAQGSQKQSAALPTELYKDIMGFAKKAVSMAMREFNEMLEAESSHANRMRSRPGNKSIDIYQYVQIVDIGLE